jgi:hypothetical protein
MKRSASAALKPEAPSRSSLWLIVGCGIAFVLLSQVPLFALAFYPLKLFVTWLHEASHGLAALLTGGSIDYFTIAPDTSGLCRTRGGFRPLINVAGYLGACVWGGALLVASRRRGWEKPVLYALGAFIGIFTLLFTRNVFGFTVGLLLAGFFIGAVRRGPAWMHGPLLAFLAVANCFNAFGDVFTLLTISSHAPAAFTDARNMSYELTAGLVPPIVFALGMAAGAVAIFLAFLRLALRGEAPARG